MLTTAQLSLESNGVDYTNDNFYAPFGTNFTVSCEGGSGSKKWGIVIASSTVDVSTEDVGSLFQRPDGQNQELVITDFQENLNRHTSAVSIQGILHLLWYGWKKVYTLRF